MCSLIFLAESVLFLTGFKAQMLYYNVKWDFTEWLEKQKMWISAVISPPCCYFQHRWFPQTLCWGTTCQASIWFSCRDNCLIFSAANSLWMKDDLLLFFFCSKCFSEVSLFFIRRTHRAIQASWRISESLLEMKFWRFSKVQITPNLFYIFSRVFTPFQLNLNFSFSEAIGCCHAAEDTCRNCSFTIPRASRTSWQRWITRPSRRAWTSWSSR